MGRRPMIGGIGEASGGAAAVIALSLADKRGQPPWRDHPVAVLDELSDFIPVLTDIEARADPSLGADIGRDEELVRAGRDERLLHARAGLECDGLPVLAGHDEKACPARG